MSIVLTDIVKRFSDHTALDGVDLEIEQGELVALLGPSGSGKTTLLRIIAGLEAPDEGAVTLFGESGLDQTLRERRVGFVFQHYALFKHMTVFENVAFGLRVKPRRERPSEAAIREQVTRLLELVQLERMAGRLPSQLSGGQRQRVALARALAIKPRLLLLDEPFGALDAQVRRELRRWLRRLHDEIGLTSVFVTHDQEEALELADRVVVLNKGRVEQIGTPEDVYHKPASPFVVSFLGSVNLFHGRVEDGRARLAEPGSTAAPVYVRPHELEIELEPGEESVAARVVHINAAGPVARIELAGERGETFHVELALERHRALELARGARVWLRPRAAQAFSGDYMI